MSDDDQNVAPPGGGRADTDATLRSRIEGLEADLSLARAAAARAESEQGRVQGELTKVSELWAAACHAQEQWDILFAENVEALRLANERADAAEQRRSEIEQSTTWRLVQAGLAPYRRLRGRR